MKSVRLGSGLEGRLGRAAQAAHLPESEIIRQGVTRRVDEILGVTVYDQIRDLVGSVRGRGDSSTMSDAQIAEELAAEAARTRRVIKPRS